MPQFAGGGFVPVLPIGLDAKALTASTALAGPIAAPVNERTATAASTVAEASVASLPELPIPLPDPDFSDVDAITVPVGTVDLRPALEGARCPTSIS